PSSLILHPSSLIPHPSRDMHRILVVGPSWIGDTVLAQPLFKLLHVRYGPLALDVLTPRWTLAIVERMPEVRRAVANPLGPGELRVGAPRQIARGLLYESYERASVLPKFLQTAPFPWPTPHPVPPGDLR